VGEPRKEGALQITEFVVEFMGWWGERTNLGPAPGGTFFRVGPRFRAHGHQARNGAMSRGLPLPPVVGCQSSIRGGATSSKEEPGQRGERSWAGGLI